MLEFCVPLTVMRQDDDLSLGELLVQNLCDHSTMVSIEAGSTFGWEKIIGSSGLKIGIDEFGASAPSEDIAKHFGFTPEVVVSRIDAWLNEYT